MITLLTNIDREKSGCFLGKDFYCFTVYGAISSLLFKFFFKVLKPHISLSKCVLK